MQIFFSEPGVPRNCKLGVLGLCPLRQTGPVDAACCTSRAGETVSRIDTPTSTEKGAPTDNNNNHHIGGTAVIDGHRLPTLKHRDI